MISALATRSLRELTRRKARSLLTIATVAAAVAGLWLFTTPQQMNEAMMERVESDVMHHVRLSPGNVDLSEDQLEDLRGLPNVAALDARTYWRTGMEVGGLIQGVWLVGVQDFSSQQVNVVALDEGVAPGRGEAVTDWANRRSGRYPGAPGDTVAIRSGSGAWAPIAISGRGGSIDFSRTVPDSEPVLYLPNDEVQRLSGMTGLTSIEIRATDTSADAVAAVVDDVRANLESALPPFTYWDVLEVRSDDTWPGQDSFDNFLVLFYVIAAVALLSALVLIYTTMNTMVREHTREIGIMKAMGGGRRQIAGVFLRAALLLGVLGTVLGIAAGIPLSGLVVSFLSEEFGGVSPGWGLSLLGLSLSLLVGIGGTLLAAIPALRRAGRISVREAIDDHGIAAGFGLRRLDRLVQRARFLPRRTQIGLRNTTRRIGRSLATSLQVTLAVGTMLAFGAVAISALAASRASMDNEGGDIILWNEGGRSFDASLADRIESVPEVVTAQPIVYANFVYGDERNVWGLPAESLFTPDLEAGRWYTEREMQDRARVAVIGKGLADITGTATGDVIVVETRRGPVDLAVIGIDGNMVNDGQGLFVPMTTVMEIEDFATPGVYWIRTTDPAREVVDRAAASIVAAVEPPGYRVGMSPRYIQKAAEEDENRIIVVVIMAMGLPIVAIGMIGLVSSMTTNILERTREIGVMRSIGARRRDVRGVFRSEGLTIALAGWLGGVPVGLGLGWVILWFLGRAFHTTFDFLYPAWPIGAALVLTLAMSLAALRLPLRRAIRMRPGSALRYQ